ncbi:PPC domain-containing protein [Nostoc sp. NMS4]|uniref:PPC domain-containing protein n=1 Tax=Nostoc sp. NMS4 TaxID=2815390 RepID=UPI0025FD3EE9|nr:PPC domain-containing protein [Nostoc sp. NMS4]MBN3922789.1 PPC domain-containing protein [Nostoc sp. NMS4]
MRDPGNSVQTAYNLGNASGGYNFNFTNEFVGSSDPNDYYRFTLSNSSNFSVTLSGLGADADLQLLDGFGNVIQSSIRSGTANDSISSNLSAGTYYARVYPFGGSNTSYNIGFTGSGAGIDPGNTFGTAFDLGEFGSNISRFQNDFVGSSDQFDYYQFSVSEGGNYKVQINNLAADADLTLYRGNQSFLGSSINSGTTPDSITTSLTPDIYYARVSSFAGNNTNYTVSVAAV